MSNTSPPYEYNFELEEIMEQFATMIDNAVVIRYRKDKETRKREFVKNIKPTYIWGVKQRVIYDIVNKAKNFILPCVIINLKSIKADKERIAAKFDKIRRNQSARDSFSYARPTPIVLSLDVTIISKYRSDLYQIYGKLATQFQPYCTYSWLVPYSQDLPKEQYEELKNKIEWDFNLDIDFADTMKETQETRFSGKMGFQVEGWLFPEMKSDKGNIIFDIGTTNYTPQELKGRLYTEESIDRLLVDVAKDNEVFDQYNNPREWGNAHPHIVNVFRVANTGERLLYFLMDKDRTFPFRMEDDSFLTLDGYNLHEADALFVPKGKLIKTDLEAVDLNYADGKLFPDKDTMDDKKPSVKGYKMNVVNRTENKLTVNFGGIQYSGEFDIVVANCRDYDSISNCIGTTLRTKDKAPESSFQP